MAKQNVVAIHEIQNQNTVVEPAPEEVYKFADALSKVIESGEATQHEIAKAIGVSPSIISQYRAKKYDVSANVLRDLDRRVGTYLRRRILRAEKAAHVFLPTSHATTIMGYLDFCFEDRTMRVIRAATACGKTHTFEEYQRQNDNVYILTCDALFSSPRPVLEELYLLVMREEMPENMKIHRGFKKIVSALKGKDALLIVDDSQYLYFNIFSQFASLYNQTGIGIVFGDQSDAMDTPGYNRSKQYDRNPQVFRRIAQPWSAEFPISYEDVALFTGHFGISNPNVTKWLFDRVNTKNTRYDWLSRIVKMAAAAYRHVPEKLNDVTIYQALHAKIWKGQTKYTEEQNHSS